MPGKKAKERRTLTTANGGAQASLFPRAVVRKLTRTRRQQTEARLRKEQQRARQER